MEPFFPSPHSTRQTVKRETGVLRIEGKLLHPDFSGYGSNWVGQGALGSGVVLAFTVVVNAVSHWSDSTDKTQEDFMENKLVHLKMVRSSVLSTIKDIGTAAIGGLLAA